MGVVIGFPFREAIAGLEGVGSIFWDSTMKFQSFFSNVIVPTAFVATHAYALSSVALGRINSAKPRSFVRHLAREEMPPFAFHMISGTGLAQMLQTNGPNFFPNGTTLALLLRTSSVGTIR